MSYTLLVADDSITVQRVIELTFADEDVRVASVGDGAAAIEQISSERPDIVLADVTMPRRDGYQVAEFLKSRPDTSQIPVILLAGAFEPVDRERARALGCADVLVKPFEPHVLVSKVKQLLEGHGEPREGIPLRDAQETQQSPDTAWATSTPPVDEYFKRLDAAFAQLNAETAEADAVGVSGVRPAPAAGQQESTAAAVTPSHPAEGAAAPRVGESPDTLALAFERLLYAEQTGISQATRPDANRAGHIDEALVERVVARVLERLDDRAMRDAANQLVAEIAERLVREEIERIKADG